MSRVKRYLAEQTEPVLDAVRLYGSAVISPATEHSHSRPYAMLQRTLELLERDWLTGPSEESRARLDSAAAAYAQWQICPPADVQWEWAEALEDCVAEALEELEDGWLSSYGLRLEWDTAGLLAVPDREERDSE